MNRFSLTKKRLLIILIVIIFLVGLPITLYQVQQKQQLEQEAIVSKTRTCNSLQVSVTDTTNAPDAVCKNIGPGQSQEFTTYSTTFTVQNLDVSSSHTYGYRLLSNFCEYANVPSGTFCSDNEQVMGEETVTIGPGESKIISTSRSSTQGACGSYQIDLEINSIDGKSVNDGSSCKWSDQPGESNLAGWGACETGIACSVAVAPTPTTAPLPELTPTFTPVPTLVPSSTPTPTTPPSPTLTSIPTPITVNIVVSPTSTPFPTPTSHPALPSVGTENVVQMGAVGIALTILGTLIFLLF